MGSLSAKYASEKFSCLGTFKSIHGLINYTDTKAKCRHLKKVTCKGTLRQVFVSGLSVDTVSHVGMFDPAL